MPPLDHAVELLDRALSYTRVALSDVRDDDLGRPTPCGRWDLGPLLAHMEDALDAFAEGATGRVDLTDRVPAHVRVDRLREKACALLAAWSRPGAPTTVRIGPHAIETYVVAQAATLEVAVHGWDVAQSVGTCRPIPPRLATGLLPVAESLVAQAGRGDQFAPPRPVPAEAPAQERLLGFLGRDARAGINASPRQGQISGNRHTGDAAAS